VIADPASVFSGPFAVKTYADDQDRANEKPVVVVYFTALADATDYAFRMCPVSPAWCIVYDVPTASVVTEFMGHFTF
jgi:hypothetical protein